ncbi:hypothetical protein D3C77_622060 [compost metagenome]
MELAAGFGPAAIEGITGHFELRGLLAKLSEGIDGITERRILIAALLGQIEIAPQLRPQA